MPNTRKRRKTRNSGRRLGLRVGHKHSKYGAIRTVIDGITFASRAEARRYSELKLMEREGAISKLKLQVKFELCVAPRVQFAGSQPPVWHSKSEGVAPKKIGSYIADFVYVLANGAEVIEDVKGFKTPIYNWKKKHLKAEYGIDIHETR